MIPAIRLFSNQSPSQNAAHKCKFALMGVSNRYINLKKYYCCIAAAADGFSFCAASRPAALLPSLSFSFA
jgi:hypothetical protein